MQVGRLSWKEGTSRLLPLQATLSVFTVRAALMLLWQTEALVEHSRYIRKTSTSQQFRDYHPLQTST